MKVKENIECKKQLFRKKIQKSCDIFGIYSEKVVILQIFNYRQ